MFVGECIFGQTGARKDLKTGWSVRVVGEVNGRQLYSQPTFPRSVLPAGILAHAKVSALDLSSLSRALMPSHHIWRCCVCPPRPSLDTALTTESKSLACLLPDTYLPPCPSCPVLGFFYRPGAWLEASPWLYLSLGISAVHRAFSLRVGGKGHRLLGYH